MTTPSTSPGSARGVAEPAAVMGATSPTGSRPSGPEPTGPALSPARVAGLPWQLKFGALALIWGSSFLLMKVGLRSLAPLQISGLRIVSGAATLLVLLRLSGGRLPHGARTWGHLAVSAVLLSVLPFTLFALAEVRVSSALAGIGNATTPLVAVLCSLVLLPSERLAPHKLAAVLVGFAGVVVIMQPWAATGRPDLLGFGMTLVAAACYGLGWTYNRRYLARADLGGLSMPTALLALGTVMMAPVLLVWWWGQRDTLAAPWSIHPSTTSGSALLPVLATLALGLAGTGFAYMLQFDVVRAAGATVSTTVTYLIPVVSVVLGVLLLDERLDWPQLLGAAVVLASAVVVGWRRRPNRATGSSVDVRPRRAA
jgi:drug/metabolite transporter (DMT)-like permease